MDCKNDRLPDAGTTPVNRRLITRRELIRYASMGTLGLLGSSALAKGADWLQEQLQQFKGQDVFARIVDRASAENWKSLPIGQLIGKVAMQLQGTPYVWFTLERSNDAEYCVVNLKGLDCVTFFEDSLCMARMIKHGKGTPEDLIREVEFTRYRGGKMGDFTTRLNYTTDWFVDNEKKGVVKIITPELPGAEPFQQRVGIMSEEPQNYRQLKAHPDLIPAIRRTEDKINAMQLKYLPMEKLRAAEPLLATGDIVGVTTTEAGIDIAHTGLCIKDEQGVAHFMDASSSRRYMKVVLEREISRCLNWSRQLTGVMFARPLEVRKA